MIERINGHFGYRAVAELRILQAPLARARRRRRAAHPAAALRRTRSLPASPTSGCAPRWPPSSRVSCARGRSRA